MLEQQHFSFDDGTGPTVLFLHGTNPPEFFHPIARYLAKKFHVVVLSMPGYANSNQIASRTIKSITTHISRVVREIAPVYLVAHSGGAYHALEIAESSPQEIESLVLLAPVYCFDDAQKSSYKTLARAARSGHVGYMDACKMWFGEKKVETREHDNTVFQDAFERDLEAIAADLETYSRATSSCVSLNHLTQPIYIRFGDQDSQVSLVENDFLDCPRIQVEQVPGKGHMLILEEAKVCAGAIEVFLTSTQS